MSTGPVDDGGSEPSGSPKRRRAALVGILAGGLVAAVLVTVAVVVVTGEDPKKADVKAAREAGRNLTKTAALALNGTYGAGRATFTVTAAGTARGIYRADGAQVSRIDVGERTYLTAPSRFWKSHGESSAIAAEADGRWAKAPDGYADLAVGNLSPDRLGRNLLDPVTSPVNTSLNGVRAIRLTADGLTYFVSTSEPHRVLRVQGRTVRGAFSFDLAPLPMAAMNTFLTALRTDVRHLKDAYNPDVIFELTGGRPYLSGCDESGCTVSGKVQPDAWGGSGAIHVVTTVKFMGTTGGVASRCSDSAMTTSKLLVRFSCRTGGGAWRWWWTARAL